MANEITWQAPEFVHYPKSKLWFVALTLLGAAAATYFLWQREFLTAAMFILLYAVVFYFSRKQPKMLTIRLSPSGISVGKMVLPWQKIQSFWIVYEPPEVKILNLKTSAYFNQIFTIQLESTNVAAVRDFLLEYLPEEENRREQFADKIGRKLKF